MNTSLHFSTYILKKFRTVVRLDLEARQYINKVLIVILTYKHDKDDENEGSLHGCLQTQFKLRSVICTSLCFYCTTDPDFRTLITLKICTTCVYI